MLFIMVSVKKSPADKLCQAHPPGLSSRGVHPAAT